MTGQCDHCAQEVELHTLAFTFAGGRFYSVDLCERCYLPREDEVFRLLVGVGEWRGNVARFRRSVVGSGKR